ncbi:hypothetical protein ADL12_37405 [Streptomyces regalis]|uniref:Uncharacterized protein n=1 Tax=Streptomyces regalis TaxID=68262 RepID=A0A117MLQ7_9ACTN|nr:hypothetical protein ADL12_37405 [Streptomyces regalis]
MRDAVVCLQPVSGARRRVFLFHHAGGSHLFVRSWAPPAVGGGGPGRGRFDQLAQYASNFTSSPLFFLVCLILVGFFIASSAAHMTARRDRRSPGGRVQGRTQ